MSTTSTQRVELPDGYSVVDRLGAGGYGEVWKATAPGGLEKAVKIVFGHCDEGMAERELKSLERIKSVRHPFLLSIERYEIVNNRLVIVTELADMSLSDCFQQHIAAGRAGIPRDQLIAYLWDAAEALDCLIDHHSLQHLDVKPENLLVVGDHIKVADFGLVKELASKTLNSVMGGMTPLYSAPEIYDNNPSPRSDQYSLAIVYQQMLTATLPFSGRTAAQLAKQHTLAQPNVNSLSEADRTIVRRALEKNPQARFASCREFISALRSVGQVSTAYINATPSSPQPQPITGDDTKSISLADTKHLRDPVCIVATQRLDEIENGVENLARFDVGRQVKAVPLAEYPLVDSQIVDVETPAFERTIAALPVPTLYVGVGGVGIKLLKAVRSRVSTHNAQEQLNLAWLAIDTERETLRTTYGEDECVNLPSEDKLHIPLRRPNQYRDDSQALLQWVSRRWLYNIPRSLQTRGFRPLGRIAIVDHAAEVLTALQKRLHGLAARCQGTGEDRPALRVVVLAGMSGGTGGGTLVDVAQAVRALCRDQSQQVHVQAVLGCTYHPESNDSLAAANMYALLTELTHAQDHGNEGENSPPGPAALYESRERPFDEIYIVHMSGRGGRGDCDTATQSVADYLLLDACGVASSAVDTIRSTPADYHEDTSFRTFNCVNLGQLSRLYTSQLQKALRTDLVSYWFEQGPANQDPDARFFQVQSNSQFARAMLARFPEVAMVPGELVTEDHLNEQKSRRSAKIRSLAKGYLQLLDSGELPLDGSQTPGDLTIIAKASERIIANFCQITEKGGLAENELPWRLLELINAQLTELVAYSVGPDKTELAATALDLFTAGPLDCGYQRYALLAAPQDNCDPALTQAIRNQLPTLAECGSTISDAYLIREGMGLKPLHLGARLAELYPDIADAAGRLHSRDDINWCDLRAIKPEVAAVSSR